MVIKMKTNNTLLNNDNICRNVLVALFVFAFVNIYSQENINNESSRVLSKQKSIEKGYEAGDKDLVIASKYEDLAKDLANQSNYIKAEEYENKAVEIYTKLNAKTQLAEALRKLAKIQEAQNKTKEAISNYGKASKNTNNDLEATLNKSDVSRLQNNGNYSEQSNSVNQKLNSFKKQSSSNSNYDNEEITTSYKQLAEIELKQNNTLDAIKNYNNALNNTNDKNEEIIIKNEIATIYANNNQVDKAIDIKTDLLREAEKTNNINERIKQQRELSKLLLLNSQEQQSLQLIQDAYNLSLQQGKTIEAKNSLLQLINFYQGEKDNSKKIELYSDFLGKLETLIKSDSSLIDKKIFEETDQKIKLLEKEKTLKDELITKKNTFNYFLIAALIVLIILVVVIIKYYFAIRTKNKKISLQSLRREMNPHFIFNSLNSVNQFIAQNDEIKANKYLSSYSSLMRTMMENSSKDFISLQKEIAQLQKYLELEHLRFNDKFDYNIKIDEAIDADAIQIPNMIIQPHLENAIWHGLRYKETKGLLLLEVKQNKSHIEIIVDDDGIGIEKSKELKTKHQKNHQSIGIRNVLERIKIFEYLYKIRINCSITSKQNNTGTVIKISIPNKIKKYNYE